MGKKENFKLDSILEAWSLLDLLQMDHTFFITSLVLFYLLNTLLKIIRKKATL